MLLKEIILTNFRQFYGEQRIEFSTDIGQNVTLIHAENGVGKTTILNALLWCFYKDTTSRFEHADKIANHQAVSEEDHEVKVEVKFESDDEEYLVTRTVNERSGSETFRAFLVQTGNYKQLDAPSVFVNSVVPKEMARYFFFDGEYAESFSSQNNKAAIKVALEDMLGCSTANQAIKDLNSVRNELEKKVAALTKNDQSAAFQAEIDKLQYRINEHEVNLIALKGNLQAAEDARDELINKLRNSENTKAIQGRREALEISKKEVLRRKSKTDAELTEWIKEAGQGLVASKLLKKSTEILNDAKLKGKIPSYIAETFVKDILDKRICICGRSFEAHTSEAAAIEELLMDAGTALATDRLMDARALTDVLSNRRATAIESYNSIKDRLRDQTDEINKIESGIQECHDHLKSSDIDEISERETALKSRNEEIIRLVEKISKIEFECEEWSRLIEENLEKRNRILKTNEKAASLQKRIQLISKTIDKLSGEIESYKYKSRISINNKVNEILDKTARRSYVAKIDDKFNLDMFYKEIDTPVARSGGENQLLSLSFIAALIEFSADRMDDDSALLKPGTSAPLILDSPFGQLDPTYQKSTAQFLPKMARQVVLLLSRTQGNQEVLDILRERVGAQYVLISENTAPQGQKPSDILLVNGKEIQCSKFDCEKNLTRIVSV